MQLPIGVNLSGDLRLQAIVNGDTITALVTSEVISINAESHYVTARIFDEPMVDPTNLDINEISGIIEFVNSSTCPEATDLATQLANIDSCVGTEVAPTDR